MNRYQVSFGNHLYKIKNKILGYKITDISNIDILVISCYDVTTLEERAMSAKKSNPTWRLLNGVAGPSAISQRLLFGLFLL